MRLVWSEVVRLLESRGSCALVTVVNVRGSAPREAGARMVMGPGDDGLIGTIGGGELEWRVLQATRRALAAGERSAVLNRYALGPELGQCCGGSVEVLSEIFVAEQLHAVQALAAREKAGPFATRSRVGGRTVERIQVEEAVAALGGAEDRLASRNHLRSRHPLESLDDAEGEEMIERFGELPQAVWLFGAGHVGRALMLALAPLPFAVTWIDQRRGVFPPVLPRHVRTIESADAAAELAAAPSGAAIVVMTHSHPLDLAIVHAALSARRFSYVGLIGSASKRSRFAQRLGAAGLDPELIDTLVCPIGLPQIRSKAPAAIATGVAADLLSRFPARTSRSRPGAATGSRPTEAGAAPLPGPDP